MVRPFVDMAPVVGHRLTQVVAAGHGPRLRPATARLRTLLSVQEDIFIEITSAIELEVIMSATLGYRPVKPGLLRVCRAELLVSC